MRSAAEEAVRVDKLVSEFRSRYDVKGPTTNAADLSAPAEARSSQAAAQIRGIALRVDGGWTAQ